MNLNIESLRNCFETAKKYEYKYIAVKIAMQGFKKPEIIINQFENFDKKLDYYEKAYDNNLILKSFNGIRIIGFVYGNTFEEIEDKLKDIGRLN